MTWQAGTPRTISRPPTDLPRGPAEDRGRGTRAYWLSPPGLVMLAATGVALAIRLYLLTRLRYLTGITEYDDGVYLGGAVSLVSGTLPYHGFAFVQPPGILLLMAPAALLAKVSAVTSAMAAARLLTVGASAACVTLLGSLVRHRGAFVTLVACGILAVYPDDIMAAHTLLLEPWMNLLVLAGARLAFREGRLATPRRLAWAGVFFGLAAAVKYWAVLPALGLLAVCLLSDPDRGHGGHAGRRRNKAVRFAGGVVAGFTVPVLPFAAPWPGLFVRSTLLDQATRAGSAVPESLRLAHLTGLADLLNDAGRLTASGNEGSLFARGDVTAAATWATGWLPVLIAVVLAALIGAGYIVGAARPASVRRIDPSPEAGRTSAPAALGPLDGPGPLEWYALGTLACTVAAVLAYSAFFYHYPDFAAPWLAISAGYAAGALAARRPRAAAQGRRATAQGRRAAARGLRAAARGLRAAAQGQRAAARQARRSRTGPWPGTSAAKPKMRDTKGPRRGLKYPRSSSTSRLTWVALAFIVVAGFQAWELSGEHAPDVHADAALIPPGACVVSDEISLTIAANRFTAGSGGCPDVLDSLATTLVAGNGISVQGGAQALPRVVAGWRAIFSRADYVWLSGSSARRIPWTPELRAWFAGSFRPLRPPPGEVSEGQVYARRR